MSKYTLINVTAPELEPLACRLRMNLPGTAYVNASERRGTVFCRIGKYRKDDVLDTLEEISFGIKATWDTAIIDHYEDTGNTHTVWVYEHGCDFSPKSNFTLMANYNEIPDTIYGDRTERIINEEHDLCIRTSF